ncbi:MAG: 16S rRNA (uracil(1498)-N(3))-methyltransferase [Leptospiraceae bacterium]|nr:16S rRNA (uracil(1498)-N(3))-methyltransferase [Leptospiraceae bacterium]
MKKRPIFFRINVSIPDSIQLTRDEIVHLKSLRLYQIDKTIEIRDGKGNSYIFPIPPNENQGELVETIKHEIQEPPIKIATAIPQSGKFEFLLQKCTEIGVREFHFINFFHSERRDFNLDRANKIFLESAAQCERHTIPEIFLHKTLEEFLNKNKLAYCLMPRVETRIKDFPFDRFQIPVVGPEGGFGKNELLLLESKKIPMVNIGNNILRIETACTFMASVLQYHLLI